MLCLDRKKDEKIVLHTSDGPVTILIVTGHATVGIDAPKSVKIRRAELQELAEVAAKVLG